MFRFYPMDEPYARAILEWQYEAPYDVYNLDPGDEAAVQAFLDPEYGYYAVVDERGDLVAFCCFGADAQVPGGLYDAPALDVGLGVRPDLTGRGRGHAYVDAVLDFARRTYAPPAFRVTIAAFNQRALRVWEQAGFRPDQAFHRSGDGTPFVVLVRKAD